MVRLRKRAAALLLGATCVVLSRFGRWSSTFVASRDSGSVSLITRHAAPSPSGMNLQMLEELSKDPEKMKQVAGELEKIMQDPEKRKAFEEYQKMAQSVASQLENDPELKDLFDDVKKNGIEAMKKYENDERILAKFSKAAGGVESMPGFMSNMMGDMPAAAPAKPAFKPGDEVIIKGLEKAPHLNEKRAMVVPPTAEEKKTLEGTDRLIVRLLDTGDQFAVKPANLRTTAQAADELMSNSLEDISLYNPALQSEAAKLRESGKLDDLQNDPELKPIFEDIKKNGMSALEKYWSDEKLMAKISKAMGG
jgi:hypothetical protein